MHLSLVLVLANLCSLMEDRLNVQLPPGTTECNHSYYNGQLILCISLCFTVAKWCDRQLLCSHLLQYMRLMVLLLQALCPACRYHAVQLAHKFLCVPFVMTPVM